HPARVQLTANSDGEFTLIARAPLTEQERGHLTALREQADWEECVEELYNRSQVINEEVLRAYGRLVDSRFHPKTAPTVTPDKKVLEPLTQSPNDAQEPGPVIVSGAALKGMIRQSLAALLSA